MKKNKFVFIESNTTGTGELLLQKTIEKGLQPIFLTNSPEKYHFLPMQGVELNPINTNDREVLLVVLRDIPDIVGLYSSSEYYIETAAWLAEKLGLPGAKVAIIGMCRNKQLLYTVSSEAEIKCPKTILVSDLRESNLDFHYIGFPVVVKPVSGSGSVGVKLCINREQLEQQLEHLLKNLSHSALMQQYIDAPEFSVELCVIQSGCVFFGITKKYVGALPYFIETGHDFPADLSAHDAHLIRKFTDDVLEALKIDFGFYHVELKLLDGAVCLIEVNPRLAGGMIPILIEKAWGIDILGELINLYAGLPINFSPAFQKFSSIRHLVGSQRGFIEQLDFKEPETADVVKLLRKKGDFFIPHGDYRDRIAYFIVSDENRENCTKRASEALKNFDYKLFSDEPVS